MEKSHFLQKMQLCPNGTKYCGYSEGKTCLIFSYEQIFESEHTFHCEEHLKKLRYQPRKIKEESLNLF